jgi:[NiFe] hydrogenase large subunit/hydrogenase large subunit
LPPHVNLLATAHYLEALEWQREIIRIHAILGGKNPHPQTYLVGGMAIPVDPDSQVAINAQRIVQLRNLAAQALEFVQKVYVPDILLVASHYKEWAYRGEGVGHYLAYGDFPTDTSGDPAALWLPQGLVFDKDLGKPPHPLDHREIREYVARSWYSYDEGNGVAKHPWDGQTEWNYTGPQPPFDMLDTEQKYSWLKAPRYNDVPMEVGPLARMAVAYAAGHSRVRELTDQVLMNLELEPPALFSTLGRIAARGIETLLIAERLQGWITELETNMNAGNLDIHDGTLWDPSSWPAQATGWGLTEAPRGALGHWVRIENGIIDNYQCVVPSTWNGSPRDAQGRRGPWEQALIGTPVAHPDKPLEILRTIHSFDPCMACAVHIVDPDRRETGQIRIV